MGWRLNGSGQPCGWVWEPFRVKAKEMNSKDYYQILGVDKAASKQAIKDAYRESALKYHPDRNKNSPDAAEKMKQVNEAYAVLSDPGKRRRYDTMKQQFGSAAHTRFRHAYTEKDIFNGSDIQQIFEEMAKTFGLRGFHEIFSRIYGSHETGAFAKGRVFSNRGKPSPFFPGNRGLSKWFRWAVQRITGLELPENGENIYEYIHLSPVQAVSGGPFAYVSKKRTKKLVVMIPPGIKEGQHIRLSGMGNEGKGGGTPGDLYLKVHIKTPILKKLADFINGIRKAGGQR
jgi:DnaJ-class molecular chaperone